MISVILRLARPSARAMRRVALQESDPASYARFQPITLGPIGNAAVLVFVAVAAIVAVPLNVLARLVNRR